MPTIIIVLKDEEPKNNESSVTHFLEFSHFSCSPTNKGVQSVHDKRLDLDVPDLKRDKLRAAAQSSFFTAKINQLRLFKMFWLAKGVYQG